LRKSNTQTGSVITSLVTFDYRGFGASGIRRGRLVPAMHIEEGAKHYDMYNGKHFDNIIVEQIQWVKQYI